MFPEDTADFDQAQIAMDEFTMRNEQVQPWEADLSVRAVARTPEFRALSGLVNSHAASVIHMAPSVHGASIVSLARYSEPIIYINLKDGSNEGCLRSLESIPSSALLNEPVILPGPSNIPCVGVVLFVMYCI